MKILSSIKLTLILCILLFLEWHIWFANTLFRIVALVFENEIVE